MESNKFIFAPSNRLVFEIKSKEDVVPALCQLEYVGYASAKVAS